MTFRKKSRYWKFKDKAPDPTLSRTHSIKRLWTSHKTDYRINEGYTKLYYQKFLHNILFPEYVQAWIKFVSLFQKTCSVKLDSCILLQESCNLKIRNRNPSSYNKMLHCQTTCHNKQCQHQFHKTSKSGK
jgi:hypothetical protein